MFGLISACLRARSQSRQSRQSLKKPAQETRSEARALRIHTHIHTLLRADRLFLIPD